MAICMLINWDGTVGATQYYPEDAAGYCNNWALDSGLDYREMVVLSEPSSSPTGQVAPPSGGSSPVIPPLTAEEGAIYGGALASVLCVAFAWRMVRKSLD